MSLNPDSTLSFQSDSPTVNNDERKTSITLIEFDCPKNQPKKLVFDLTGNGYHCGQITVLIDQHYSKDVAEEVARTFLHRRLAALAREAERDAMTDEELRTLWARFKPAHYPS
jgi:hypothetical protein